MTSDMRSSQSEGQFTTIDVRRRARVIVVRGVIRGAAVDELRERLLAAIEAQNAGGRPRLERGREPRLARARPGLPESVTFADRGGVLLVWSRKYTAGEPTYVITEVHDQALAALMPPRRSTRRARRRA